MKQVMAPLGMAALFVVSQCIAAVVAPSFKSEGFETFENPNDPVNIFYIFSVIIIFTALILFIAKYKEDFVKYIILFSFFLASLSIFDAFFYLLVPSLSSVIAIFVAIIMIILIIRHPEWYVVDLFGVFLAGGIAALFAISLSLELILIFLIVLAAYDAISVYKTKHMVRLAETITSSHLPLLLMVPKNTTFSYRKLKKLGRKRDAVYMGLGDFIIPGWLIAYASVELGFIGFFITLVGALVGYVVLMALVSRGPQPGLPLLNGGAITAFALIYWL